MVELVDGVLRYFSDSRASSTSHTAPSPPSSISSADASPPSGINMSSGVSAADGQWHRFSLEASGPALVLRVDGAPAGYELEASAAHDFVDPDVEEFVLGEDVTGGGPGELLLPIDR